MPVATGTDTGIIVTLIGMGIMTVTGMIMMTGIKGMVTGTGGRKGLSI
ncbi:MAG: hypothetical protein HGA78_02060 [Nitrospirales bacterium]|nr:hypothetical protein [Nitrospirales bacterium]